MPQWAYLLIAIAVIVALLAVFIVSYVLYRRTPAPKGCENLGPDSEKCAHCSEYGCHFNLYGSDKKEEKK